MTPAMIDLDRPVAVPATSRRRRRVLRPAVLAALAATMLVLGGAAPVRTGLTPVLRLPAPVVTVRLAAGAGSGTAGMSATFWCARKGAWLSSR